MKKQKKHPCEIDWSKIELSCAGSEPIKNPLNLTEKIPKRKDIGGNEVFFFIDEKGKLNILEQ